MKRLHIIRLRKRKGEKRFMPKDLIQEFVGKVCLIMIYGEDLSNVTGKIVAVEDNWIKVEGKKDIQLINGDMIKRISIMPEKYQK